MRSILFRTALVSAFACASCTTTPSGDTAATTGDTPPATNAIATQDARITYAAKETRLGEIVRDIGEQAGGGLVLMHGLERRLVKAVAFEHAALPDVARRLAEVSGCALQESPNAFFLFEPGYEALRDVSLAGQLPKNYNGVTAEVTFGAGTQLFNVFRILGQGLNVTVVADNAVADAHCGELSLGEIPLQESLEAILKSARIAPGLVRVKATPDYIFIYGANRDLPETQLLGGRDLVQRTRELLDERVTVDLPHHSAGAALIDIELGAKRLGDSLDELSRQVGFRVVAERDLYNLPVNPVTMTRVEVRDALDLLIGQWLVNDYGYQVTQDRIVIRRRQPGE